MWQLLLGQVACGAAIRNSGEEANRPTRRTVIRDVYDKVEFATGSHDRKLCVLDLQEFWAKSEGRPANELYGLL